MEGLRPDRDELDRFNSRQPKSKKTKEPGQTKKRAGRDGVLLFVVFVLLGVCVFLGWGYLSQQARLESMQTELSSATNFVNHSKLLMARFEGELNEADVEMQESGSVIQNKLAFLDSEMRKLWGVSNDRNKKSIKKNEQMIADLEKLFGDSAEAQKEGMSKLSKAQAAFQGEVKGFENRVSQLESMVTVATSEISVTRELLNDEVNDLKVAIQATEPMSQSIQENKQAIDSIDASRLQLNQRIVSLEGKLNKLRLELSGAKQQTKAGSGSTQNDVVEAR